MPGEPVLGLVCVDEKKCFTAAICLALTAAALLPFIVQFGYFPFAVVENADQCLVGPIENGKRKHGRGYIFFHADGERVFAYSTSSGCLRA